jgi:uncharacterized membrane protein
VIDDGIFGAATAGRILLMQALPAAIAVIAPYLA